MNQELNRPVPPIPALKDGDRLTRAEFERRYEAMPHVKKAELIKGVVHMPSPVHFRAHSKPHGLVTVWLGLYSISTPGVEMGDNGTVRLDDISEPQPDVFLMLPPSHDGHAKIDDDDYIAGAPELVVEVAATSASIDLHQKFDMYLEAGVKEYLIWRTYAKVFDWFVLVDGRFENTKPSDQGIYQSTVFPGLWLDAPALLDDNGSRVLEIAQQGIASPEHAAFVAGLRRRAATS